MGNVKNKCKQTPCHLFEPEKEPQSQSQGQQGLGFVEGLGNNDNHERVVNVAGNSTKEELFLEGNEDEDEDPCERRKAYKKVYYQSYRH